MSATRIGAALERSARVLLAAMLLVSASAAWTGAQVRVRDLAARPGEAPRRLVGYGLVVGLDGSGDRNLGGTRGSTPSVRSVMNLLRRFDIEIPHEQLRLRNVAAVLVTAEVSPYLRAGGRFDVQVSAIGDASSLRGGVLWTTPLVTDPDAPPTATAQGPVTLTDEDGPRTAQHRRGNSVRIPAGGVLEVDVPVAAVEPRLLLREPDLAVAGRIAAAIDAAHGAGTATVVDPGVVTLQVPADRAAQLPVFLAAIDTLTVTVRPNPRIVIDRRAGTIVAGGEIPVGPAVVSHRGITLQVGGASDRGGESPEGFVRVPPATTIQDIAAGLHAAGARSDDLLAIFESLRAAGVLRAEVAVR